jgi:hypothetical protein
MIRSQILLSQELDKEIKKVSQKQGISQSETVRKLLSQALSLDGQRSKGFRRKKDTLSLIDLSDFNSNNSRIVGFRELFSVGAKTTEIKILPDSVFRYYREKGKIPDKLEYKILKIAEEIRKGSVNGKLVVRRAFVVPGLENPPGPRFVGVSLTELIDSIYQIYDFAIEHEYYVKKDSQIAVFFYPFADPEPLSLPIKANSNLPYGGYAVPLNSKASRVEVLAVWGNNEGVQSFDAIDRYIVDAERGIILQKNIPQKMVMFCTTEKDQSEKLDVPQDKQFEQVISDIEALETARIVQELSERYGLRRIEFSYDGKKEIIFNESSPYEISETKMNNFTDKVGRVRTVKDERDVERLEKISAEEIGSTIIYIDRSIVEERSYDILNSVAGLSKKFTVLYPGLSATAHAMRVLNDFGHTAITVGTRKFREGEEVMIRSVNGNIRIELISTESMRNFVVNLHDAILFDKEVVGGKALNLSLLKSKGFNVPHGLVLTTKCFGKKSTIENSIWARIENKLELEPETKYAVRSSANVEDTSEHSFAGQFKTFLNVDCGSVKEKIIKVTLSIHDNEIKKYIKALGIKKEIRMAVIVQKMVDSAKSGVVFGKDIQTGDSDLIVIDVSRGFAQGVVEGTSKTQRIIYSRSKDRVLSKVSGSLKKLLTRMEIDSLVEMAQSVENLMGEPQDIEWTIDKKGTIWLIQTRSLN